MIKIAVIFMALLSTFAYAKVDESKMQLMVEPDYTEMHAAQLWEGLYDLYKANKPTATDQKEWALMADNLTGYMLETPRSQASRATRKPKFPEIDQSIIIARYSPASSSAVPGGHLGRIDVHQLVRDLQGNMQSVVFPYRTTAGERWTRAQVTAKNADGSTHSTQKMYFNGRDPVIDAAKGIGANGGTGDTKIWHNLSLEGFLTYVGMAQREHEALFSLVAVPKIRTQDWTSCSGFLCSEKTYNVKHWLQPEWYIGYATGVRTDGMFPMICLNGDKACGNDPNSLLFGGVQFVKAESGSLPVDDPVLGMTNFEMSDLPNFEIAVTHFKQKGLGFFAMLALVAVAVVAIVATGGALSIGVATIVAQIGGYGAVAAIAAASYTTISLINSGGDINALLNNEVQSEVFGSVSDGKNLQNTHSGKFDPTHAIYQKFILPNIEKIGPADSPNKPIITASHGCTGNYAGYPAGCDFLAGAFQGKCERNKRNFECNANEWNGVMYRADGYQETNLTRINKYLEGKMTIKFKDPTEYDGIRGNLYQYERMQNRVKKYPNAKIDTSANKPQIKKERASTATPGNAVTGQTVPDPAATEWAKKLGLKCTELQGSYSLMSPEGKAKVQRITGCAP